MECYHCGKSRIPEKDIFFKAVASKYFKGIPIKADVYISERCKNDLETNHKTLSKSSPRILPFKRY